MAQTRHTIHRPYWFNYVVRKLGPEIDFKKAMYIMVRDVTTFKIEEDRKAKKKRQV